MSILIVSQYQPQLRWPYKGATATLRIQYNSDFIASDGQQIVRGLYRDIACAIVSQILTIPQFDLITTNDALVNRLATCSARLHDAKGTPRDWLFQQFVIPQSLSSPTTIAALVAYNQNGRPLVSPPDFYLTQQEIIALINAVVPPVVHASATVEGSVFLSVNPTLLTQPTAWGFNDDRVRDAVKIRGTDVTDAFGPADGNALVYRASTNKYEPTALANRAFQEVPTGVIDGINGTFTLSRVPVPGSVRAYLGPAATGPFGRQHFGDLGAGTESFTMAAEILTHNLPPQPGDLLFVDYDY